MTITELVAVLGFNVNTSSLRRAEVAIRGAETMLAGAAIAAAAVGAAITGIAVSTAEYGNRFEKAAQKVGMNAQTLQAYAYAGSVANVEQQSMIQGLALFAKNADLARQGSEETRRAFQQLGVKITDSSGKLRPLNDLVLDSAGKISAMGDGTQKTALVMELFGRSGKDMLPFLNQGSAGIARMTQEANDLGLVLDDKAVKESAQFNESVMRLRGGIRGLTNAIGTPLIQPLTKLIDRFTDWIKLNRAWIAADILGVFHALGKAWHVAAEAVDLVRKNLWLLKPILGTIIVMQALDMVAALAAITAGEVEWGMAALIAGARAAAATTLAGASAIAAALPWIALAAIIYLVGEDIYYFFTNGDSVIGRYGEKWTHLLDSVFKARPTDNWLVAWLKAVGRALEDVQGSWEKFKKSITGGDVKGALGGDLAATTPLGMAYRAARFVGGEGEAAVNHFLGPTTAPAGAHAGASNVVNIHNEVHASPGMSAHDVGGEVARQTAAALQVHLNAAAVVHP